MIYSGPIPQIGLGTYGRTGEEGVRAILEAIDIGYRHFDTAQSYGTERQVGEAIRRSGLPRKEVFVTTKVADTQLDKTHFLPSVEASLAALELSQIDLLLIHWPSQNDAIPFEEYMLALAEARERGLTRLIGVSNFPIRLLDRTLKLLGPRAIATNQVEIHPYLQAPKLRDFAHSIGLPLTAYRPLANGEAISDAALQRIAAKHGASPAAVSLAFLMAEGHIVIPASGSAPNLAANFEARNLLLSDSDMAEIRALDRGHRRINPAKSPRWDD